MKRSYSKRDVEGYVRMLSEIFEVEEPKQLTDPMTSREFIQLMRKECDVTD